MCKTAAHAPMAPLARMELPVPSAVPSAVPVVTGPVVHSYPVITSVVTTAAQAGELAGASSLAREGRTTKKPLRCLTVHRDYTIVDTVANSLRADYSLMQHDESLFMSNEFVPTGKFSDIALCAGAVRIMTLPNAGGTSVNSEALSFEVLRQMFNARLDATEMELQYWPENSKITDYSVVIQKRKFGVSVTRAMKFGGGRFTEEDATRLLSKKLYGVVESTKAVIAPYKWKKQILHVWAQNNQIADMLRAVYDTLIPSEMQSNTVVVVTVAKNADWVFFEREG
mmetsp:Transcript_20276/g.77621  ORF Transcript_20276/g.77621 Transcript_20276/m.77621 type:complete len:283 (-) Transcript_20276:287-1135(-)